MGASGERALLAAVLHQAIRDATASSAISRAETMSARDFLTGDSRWFRTVCSLIDVDPDVVRAWAQEQARQGWRRADCGMSRQGARQ